MFTEGSDVPGVSVTAIDEQTIRVTLETLGGRGRRWKPAPDHSVT